MQTLTVQLTNQNALKALHSLEEKHFIRIVKDIDSPSLPGSPISLRAFKEWVTNAESNDTLSLNEARQKWTGKRKQLQKLTR